MTSLFLDIDLYDWLVSMMLMMVVMVVMMVVMMGSCGQGMLVGEQMAGLWLLIKDFALGETEWLAPLNRHCPSAFISQDSIRETYITKLLYYITFQIIINSRLMCRYISLDIVAEKSDIFALHASCNDW